MSRRTCAVALAALARGRAGGFRPPGQPQLPVPDQHHHARLDGLSVDVLNRDDRLLLHNASGARRRDRGLRRRALRPRRPTARSRSTRDSPAFYLNDDRFGDVDAAGGRRRQGRPALEELSRTGRFEWHDHRMHWMSQPPPEGHGRRGADEDLRLEVAARRQRPPRRHRGDAVLDAAGGAAARRRRRSSLLAAVIIACCIAVVVVRRRRAPGGRAGEAW